ncbi:MAG: hypothetical protein QOF48_3030 [Verrucomicrobiota bacterium]|jgi:tetratricopeptide (TPR) repeat protein
MPDDRTEFVVVLRTGQLIQFDWTINALDEANIPHIDSQEGSGGLVTAPVFSMTGPGTWFSVSVPAHLVEKAKEIMAVVPGGITTEPDVWDFRPKRGVKTGWKILIIAGFIAPFCFFLLGLLLLSRGDPSRRGDEIYWYNAGMSHHRLSNYESAIGCFDEVLRQNRKLANAWLARGICRTDMGDYTNAVMDLQYACVLGSTNRSTLMGLARAQTKLGQFQPALESYNKAWRLDTNNIDLFKARGFLFEKMKSFDAAIADFNHALAISPLDAYSLQGRAYCLARTNRFDEAIATYTQAIAIEPNNARLYDGRGYTHQLNDEWEMAANDYERALRINPYFGSSIFGLAEYCFQKGAYVDAWSFVRKAEKARTPVPSGFLEKLKMAMPQPREESTSSSLIR